MIISLIAAMAQNRVIGKGGSVLKEVGTLARAQMPAGVFLELRVKVDKDWQRRPDRVERLGY